jgi:AcrR family transcriptional regulator
MPKVVPGYKEQARSRILKAGQEVISEKGYFMTRMEDIADRVGVSKRTLYLYFKNKEELFRAMCSEEPKQIKKMLRECFEAGGAGMACGTFFDFSTAGPLTGLEFEIIAAASRNGALKRIEKELFDSEIEIVSQFLKQDMRTPSAAKGFDSRQKARVLIALHLGLKAILLMGANKSDLRQAWIEATDRIMNGP